MEQESRSAENLPKDEAALAAERHVRILDGLEDAWRTGRRINDLTAKRIARELDPGSGPLHDFAESGGIPPDIGADLAVAEEVLRDVALEQRIPWVAALRRYVDGRLIKSEMPYWHELGRDDASGVGNRAEQAQVPRVDIEFGSLNLIAPDGRSWEEWVIEHGIDDAKRQDCPVDHRTACYIAGWLTSDLTTALRNFVLTGAIDGPGIQEELVHGFFAQTGQVQTWIDWFGQYCMLRQDRGPVGDWQLDIERQDQAAAQQLRRKQTLAEADALFEQVPTIQRIGNGGQPGWHGLVRLENRSGGWIVSEGLPGDRRMWETDSTQELEDAYVGIVEAQRQWVIDTWGRGASSRGQELARGSAGKPPDPGQTG
jgi:hypothetical protein